MSNETYHDIKLEEGFRCQPANLYEALTDPKLIATYTQSPATTNLTPGGHFSYFDGQITGTYTALTPPTAITQTLRFKEWNDTDTSTLSLTLTPLDRSTTRLTLHHTHVPEHDRYGNRDVAKKVEEGWKQFFFLRIQHVMGYSKQAV